MKAVSDREKHDRRAGKKHGDGEQIKPDFTDIIAFIIAAFQILIPYLAVFILAILLVPAFFYLIVFLTGR